MKKFYLSFLAVWAMLFAGLSAQAIGWPDKYQGVMLQGFYWDSYKTGAYGTTKWSDLTRQADELSKYFKLIWVPNSAKAAGGDNGGNGYMPMYWFTNHNTNFGTENELKTMIETFQAKGTGFIEDVVVNHRAGTSNWWNFPSETWNGQTWQLTTGSITSTDEIWRSSDAGATSCPSSYKGNADTGEDFDGARDLDHTNTTVQNHVKNYCKSLLDRGYIGFRYDMVKGYGGQYIKIYNQYSKPTYSVGEYWDGSYDAVTAWINATGRESAAFDFPCKYAINDAFHSGDLTKLVWAANGTTKQPAGLIHYGYAQLAVTFVDNHDTFRDNSKFNGNIVAANAFILFSPGTPCVFWPHYITYKDAIQTLIDLRNEVGIHNTSAVNVLKSTSNCYAAEVTGTKGKAIIKIGSDMDFSPSTDYKMRTYGNDYCVWTTTEGDVVIPKPSVPSNLYIVGTLQSGAWDPENSVVAMTKDGNSFKATNVKLVGDDKDATSAYFNLITVKGNWDTVNSSARYAPSETEDVALTVGIPSSTLNSVGGGAKSWKVAPGTYTVVADFENMTITVSGNSDVVVPDPKVVPAVIPQGQYAIFVKASQAPKLYVWGGSSTELNGGWSGNTMDKTCVGNSGQKYYYYVVPSGYASVNCIINFNGDNDKTADLKNITKNTYFEYMGSSDAGKTLTAQAVPTDIVITTGEIDNPVILPDVLYLLGNIGGTDNHWNPAYGLSMTKSGNTFMIDNIELEDGSLGSGEPASYFNLATAVGPGTSDDSWSTVNNSDRYGATTSNAPLSVGGTSPMKKYAVNVDASGTQSWKVTPGKYKITADFENNVVKLENASSSGVEDVTADVEADVEYYNLQGIRVANPENGIYIRRQGNSVTKVLVK